MTKTAILHFTLVAFLSLSAFGQDEVVAPMFRGRSGPERQQLLEVYGGTPETEKAVEQGLRWLSQQQQADGAWSLNGPYNGIASHENRTAATAMALIAFLGAGYTDRDGDYKQNINSGIRWLVDQQDEQGFFARKEVPHHRAYTQALASIAVAELYAMTGEPTLEQPAQLAIRYAEESQGPDGGWRYSPRSSGDMSVTGWYVMTLQSGLAAGLKLDQPRIEKTMDFLDTVQADGGAGYGYIPTRKATAGMTAEGLLCRQYLGWPRDHEALGRGVARLANEWKFDPQGMDVYYWFHATQVLRHCAGSPWLTWNELMREELPAMQVKSGREAGSWEPKQDRWGKESGGRLFTTCFAIYCLEVYYRHKPLYDEVEGN